MRSWVWGTHGGISALWNRDQRAWPLASHSTPCPTVWAHSKKAIQVGQEEGFHQEPSLWHIDLGLPNSRTVRNKHLLFKLIFRYSSPSWVRQSQNEPLVNFQRLPKPSTTCTLFFFFKVSFLSRLTYPFVLIRIWKGNSKSLISLAGRWVFRMLHNGYWLKNLIVHS